MYTLVLTAIVQLSSGWSAMTPQITPNLTLEHCETLGKSTLAQYQRLFTTVAPRGVKHAPEAYTAEKLKIEWSCLKATSGG